MRSSRGLLALLALCGVGALASPGFAQVVSQTGTGPASATDIWQTGTSPTAGFYSSRQTPNQRQDTGTANSPAVVITVYRGHRTSWTGAEKIPHLDQRLGEGSVLAEAGIILQQKVIIL